MVGIFVFSYLEKNQEKMKTTRKEEEKRETLVHLTGLESTMVTIPEYLELSQTATCLFKLEKHTQKMGGRKYKHFRQGSSSLLIKNCFGGFLKGEPFLRSSKEKNQIKFSFRHW